MVNKGQTPQEKLKGKLYQMNISPDIPKKKKPFNLKEFKKKAKEIRRTFKKDESPIRFEHSF